MIRMLDVVLSGLLILVLFPFMVPIVIILSLTGEHHVLYRQERVGKGGVSFPVLKFATMLRDSPRMRGGLITSRGDPRVLPFGRILRKLKINEVPQLLNILVGQMSFVGPRPQARPHFEVFPEGVRATLMRAVPGLTGLGSIVFRDEEDLLADLGGDSEAFYGHVIAPYKGALEVWYEDHRSLKVYFQLIALTAACVLFPNLKLYKSLWKDLPQAPKELEARL